MVVVVKFFITFLALTSSKINIDHHEERHSCKMSAALQFMCLRALSGQKNRNVKKYQNPSRHWWGEWRCVAWGFIEGTLSRPWVTQRGANGWNLKANVRWQYFWLHSLLPSIKILGASISRTYHFHLLKQICSRQIIHQMKMFLL